MGVAHLIGKMVVLAVDGGPLARHHAGEQAQLQVHQQRHRGMQLQPPMGLGAVQIDGGEKTEICRITRVITVIQNRLIISAPIITGPGERPC